MDYFYIPNGTRGAGGWIRDPEHRGECMSSNSKCNVCVCVWVCARACVRVRACVCVCVLALVRACMRVLLSCAKLALFSIERALDTLAVAVVVSLLPVSCFVLIVPSLYISLSGLSGMLGGNWPR